MKRILLFVAAIAGLISAASCQQEKLEVVEGNKVAYSVKVPESLQTKANAEDYILNYEVYRAADVDDSEASAVYEGTATFNGGIANFDLEFVKNQNFVVLFWAQTYELQSNTESPMYNIADLRKVQLVNCGASNNANAAVFAGKDEVVNCASTNAGEIKLVRPISQLNIYTTKESLSFGTGINLIQSSVTVSGLYASYNVAEGGAVVTDATETYEYSLADVPATADEDKYAYVAMNYIGFATNDGSSISVDFTIQTSESNPIIHNVENVPVKPNYRTNIVGNLLTGTTDYNVTLDTEWGGFVVGVRDAEELQNAIDNATVGTTTVITFINDINGDVNILQRADVNLVINGKGYKYDGKITVDGNNRNDGRETLLLTNINFETSYSRDTKEDEWTFINSTKTNNYSHNVTIDNCTFKNTVDGNYRVGAVNFKTTYNFIMSDCTANNMHSLLQLQSVDNENVLVENVTVDNCKNGVAFGTTVSPVLKNSTINAIEYGVRADGDGRNCNLTLENTTVTAKQPVIVRKVNNPSYKYTANLINVTLNTEENFEVIFTNGSDDAAYLSPNGQWAVSGADDYSVYPRDYLGEPVVEDGVKVSGVLVNSNNYYISNANGFKWLATKPAHYFAGKTINLTADINFNYENLKPINFGVNGDITGVVFDGQNHTLSCIMSYEYVPAWSNYNDNQALFNGKVDIKNLKVDYAGVYGRGYAGVIGGTIYGSLENCHVSNSGVEGYYWQAGALVGQYCGGSIKNCSVTGTHVNSYAAVGALVGLMGDTSGAYGVRVFENCTVTGCEVRSSGSLGEYYDNSFGVVAGWIDDGINVKVSNCTFNNNVYVTDRNTGATAELPICGKYPEGALSNE